MERLAKASFGRGCSGRHVDRVLSAPAKHGRFGPASSNPQPQPLDAAGPNQIIRQLAVLSAMTVVAPTMAPGVSLSFIF
jgi:hypothetical protein